LREREPMLAVPSRDVVRRLAPRGSEEPAHNKVALIRGHRKHHWNETDRDPAAHVFPIDAVPAGDVVDIKLAGDGELAAREEQPVVDEERVDLRVDARAERAP